MKALLRCAAQNPCMEQYVDTQESHLFWRLVHTGVDENIPAAVGHIFKQVHGWYLLYLHPPYIQSLLGATAATAGSFGVFLQHSGPHHVHITVQVIQ